MPVCEAVRLTRRAISPRLAIRMERRGSVAGAVFVLVCRRVRLGWRAAVVLRRARSLDGVDIVEDVGDLLAIGNGELLPTWPGLAAEGVGVSFCYMAVRGTMAGCL